MGLKYSYIPLLDDGTLFSSLLPPTSFVDSEPLSVWSCYLSITNISGSSAYRMPDGVIDAIIGCAIQSMMLSVEIFHPYSQMCGQIGKLPFDLQISSFPCSITDQYTG